MDSLKGYWEESFDGFFNADRFVICPYQLVGGEEIEEDHPLVGGWNSPEEVQLLADRLGLKILIIEE